MQVLQHLRLGADEKLALEIAFKFVSFTLLEDYYFEFELNNKMMILYFDKLIG